MSDPMQDLIIDVMLAQQKDRGETPDRAACLAQYRERQEAKITFQTLLKKEPTHESRTRKRRPKPQG